MPSKSIVIISSYSVSKLVHFMRHSVLANSGLTVKRLKEHVRRDVKVDWRVHVQRLSLTRLIACRLNCTNDTVSMPMYWQIKRSFFYRQTTRWLFNSLYFLTVAVVAPWLTLPSCPRFFLTLMVTIMRDMNVYLSSMNNYHSCSVNMTISQSTWSWKMSLTYPGSPASGVAQNGHVARKPRQPWGIGIDAQYLRATV